jgi:hypothetical protein
MQNLEFSGPTEARRLEPKLLPAAPNWDPTGKLQIQTWENPLLTLRTLRDVPPSWSGSENRYPSSVP